MTWHRMTILVCIVVSLSFAIGVLVGHRNQATKAAEPPKLETMTGTFKSVQVYHVQSLNRSIAGFDTDDGKFRVFCFERIEPQIWPELRAKVTIKERKGLCGVDNLEVGDYPVYELFSLDRLDKH